MPRTKSAKKQLRQTKTRTLTNRMQRSKLRTALKKVRTAASGADAQRAYTEAVQLLDRAGQKNLIHRNTADRQKSRLAKFVAAKAQ